MTRVRLLSRVRERMRHDVETRDRTSASASGGAEPASSAADASARTDFVPVRRSNVPAPDLPQLEAEARYHRDRLALYRARASGGKDTDHSRLRELQRMADAAADRLSNARRTSHPESR